MRQILEKNMSANRAEGTAATLLMLLEGATLMAQMGQGETAIGEAKKAALSLLTAPAAPQ
jgi:hypothetical protein